MSIKEKKAETLAMATDVSNRTRRVLQHVKKGEWAKAHAESSDAMVQSLRMLQAVAIMKAIEEGLVKEKPPTPKAQAAPEPRVWGISSISVSDSTSLLFEVAELDAVAARVRAAFNELNAHKLLIYHRPTQIKFTVSSIWEFKETLPKMLKLQEEQEAGKASHLWTGETGPAPSDD